MYRLNDCIFAIGLLEQSNQICTKLLTVDENVAFQRGTHMDSCIIGEYYWFQNANSANKQLFFLQ